MRSLALIALLGLTACAHDPIKPPKPPKVVEVVVEKIVPVPAELSKACEQHEPKANTVGEAVRIANARKLALEECSARMARIRGLVE